MDERRKCQLKAKLKSEFYVMNDDWLFECIAYYVSTHVNSTDREILEFVKAQWQLSDLREINNKNGSLPPNLRHAKYTVLNGTHILQMLQAYDISTSKYKQLDQIRNPKGSNLDTGEKKTQDNWQPPKKRMMYLHLTDGIQNINAMEYQYMACFNETMVPGYKLMIIGPVKCRKGVLLLEEGRLKGVGGEVESLLIPNALENVLARVLKLYCAKLRNLKRNRRKVQENPDPYKEVNLKKQKSEEISNTVNQDEMFDDDFHINIDEIHRMEISQTDNTHAQQSKIKSGTQARTTTSKQPINDVIFIDEEICNSAGRKTGNKKSNTTNKKPAQSAKTVRADDFLPDDEEIFNDDYLFNNMASESVKNKASNKTDLTASGFPFDDDDIIIDDDFVDTPRIEITKTNKTTAALPASSNSNVTGNHGGKTTKSSEFRSEITAKTNEIKTLGKTSSRVDTDCNPTDNEIFDFMDAPFEIVPEKIEIKSSSQVEIPDDDDFLIEMIEEEQFLESEKKQNLVSPFRTMPKEDPAGNKNDIIVISNNETCQKKSWMHLKKEEPPDRKESGTNFSNPKKFKTSTASFLGGKRPAALVSSPDTRTTKRNRKITEFAKVLEPTEPLNSDPPKICDFIKEITSEVVVDVAIKTIRGRTKEIGKLGRKDSLWVVEGTIQDETDELKVTFSNEVLEKLLGFSVEEFSKKKKLKKDPKIDHELRMGLRHAEKKLKNLDALLELELKPETMPKVINILPLTEQQKGIIERRANRFLRNQI